MPTLRGMTQAASATIPAAIDRPPGAGQPGVRPASALHRATGASWVVSAASSTASSEAPPSPPEWVMLIPAGTFSGRDGRGPYRFGPEEAAAVLGAFTRLGRALPVDYDHQSIEAEAKAGPVPAAGWIEALELREGALWGRVAWTERAAAAIGAREYRHLSPVFRHDRAGRVLALEGAGLTHYPNLHLVAVQHFQEGEAMDLKPLAEALGAPLPEGEAPEQALGLLVTHARSLREQVQAAPDPREWVPVAQHRAVADELATLQRAIAREKALAAVTAAMSAGKLPPAMRAWAEGYAERDLAGFEAWVAAAPVVVAHGQRLTQGAPSETGGAALSDEERYVCRALGIAEGDYAAHRQGGKGEAHARAA